MSDSKKEEAAKNAVVNNLFGPKLLTSIDKTETTSQVLKEKDIVLLYFSASWCPPCRGFTPDLSKFYNHYCLSNGIEIIFISSDKDVPSFNEYYGKMPWKSLPVFGTAQIKQKLADRLKISGIPALIALDANTGHFISDTARLDVAQALGSDEKSKSLIESWKNTEAVPIEEAQLSGSGPDGLVK